MVDVNEQEDFYSILNCDKSATYEELKQSYQQLIRKYHPDKNNTSQEEKNRFLKIDKAWKTLREPESRKEYDVVLQEKEFNNVVIFTQIQRDSLHFDGNNVAKYPCRCGNDFIIEKEFNEEECLIECDECSNYILVK